MDDGVREKLKDLVRRYGTDVTSDPRRCLALLKDLFPGRKREVKVLQDALQDGVVDQLHGATQGVPPEVTVARLSRRLVEDAGLADDAARWAVESWALALGVLGAPPADMRTPPAASEPTDGAAARGADAPPAPVARHRKRALAADVAFVILAALLVAGSAVRLRRATVPGPPSLPAPERAADQSSPVVSIGPDGAEMVLIPAGPFTMGSPDGVGDADEHPQWRIHLSAYRIHKCPVTVAQYRRFCQATGRDQPPSPGFAQDDDHPVVEVTWEDADAYARHYGLSLPTEAQWEKAARGSADARLFPWGDEWDAGKANTWNGLGPDEWPNTSPVGSFPAGSSPYGVLDMAGNVWEWCSDWYLYDWYGVAPDTDPVNTTPTGFHVLRGGSWGDDHAGEFRVAYRTCRDVTYGTNASDVIGFRCVVAGSGGGAPRITAKG